MFDLYKTLLNSINMITIRSVLAMSIVDLVASELFCIDYIISERPLSIAFSEPSD